MALLASQPAPASSEAGRRVAAAEAKPRLHRCDLGPPRPFRCGQISVPLFRGQPAAGRTRIGFAVRPRSQPPAALAGHDRRGRGRPRIRGHGGPVRKLDAGRAGAAAAAARAGARRRPRHRPLRGAQLPRAAAGKRSRADRRRPLRPSAWRPLRRLHDGGHGRATSRRSAGRSASGRSSSTGIPTAPCRARPTRHASSPSCEGLILDSAYPADDPYYRTLFPAARRAMRIACRRFACLLGRTDGPPTQPSSGASTPAAGRPAICSASCSRPAPCAPRSYLNLDEATGYFLRGRKRRLNNLIDPGPPGHGAGARLLLRPGDRGRVQRLPAALERAGTSYRADAAAGGGDQRGCRATTSRPSAAAST